MTASRYAPTLDAAPILDTVDARGGVSAILGHRDDRAAETDRRAIQRARQRGIIGAHTADRVCIRVLGCHPALVYGSAWWRSIGPPDEIAERWAAGDPVPKYARGTRTARISA